MNDIASQMALQRAMLAGASGGGGPQPYTITGFDISAPMMKGANCYTLTSITAGYGMANISPFGKLLNATSNTISSKTGGNGLKSLAQNIAAGFAQCSTGGNQILSQQIAEAGAKLAQASATAGPSTSVSVQAGLPGGMGGGQYLA